MNAVTFTIERIDAADLDLDTADAMAEVVRASDAAGAGLAGLLSRLGRLVSPAAPPEDKRPTSASSTGMSHLLGPAR